MQGLYLGPIYTVTACKTPARCRPSTDGPASHERLSGVKESKEARETAKEGELEFDEDILDEREVVKLAIAGVKEP